MLQGRGVRRGERRGFFCGGGRERDARASPSFSRLVAPRASKKKRKTKNLLPKAPPIRTKSLLPPVPERAVIVERRLELLGVAQLAHRAHEVVLRHVVALLADGKPVFFFRRAGSVLVVVFCCFGVVFLGGVVSGRLGVCVRVLWEQTDKQRNGGEKDKNKNKDARRDARGASPSAKKSANKKQNKLTSRPPCRCCAGPPR